MKDRRSNEGATLEDSRIVSVELLDASSLAVQFSNGSTAKLAADVLKRLVLDSGCEVITPGEGLE